MSDYKKEIRCTDVLYIAKNGSEKKLQRIRKARQNGEVSIITCGPECEEDISKILYPHGEVALNYKCLDDGYVLSSEAYKITHPRYKGLYPLLIGLGCAGAVLYIATRVKSEPKLYEHQR